MKSAEQTGCERTLWALGLMMACFVSLTAEDLNELDDLDALIEDEEGDDLLGGGRLNELLMKMEHGRATFRRSAIWASRTQTESKKLVAKLVEFLKKDKPEIATISAVTLGMMKAKSALPVLQAALRHSSSEVREAAAHALGLIGEKTALPHLQKNIPRQAGLSRWIYEDAISHIKVGKDAASPHSGSLKGGGIFYLGVPGTVKRDEWRNLVSEFGLRVYGAPSRDLNEVLLKYGGPPDLKEFFSLLEDKDGKPQLDVVIVGNMLAYEFPWQARWKIYQFVRRGGALIVLGNGPFVSGEIRTVQGRVVHHFAMPYQLWHSALPQTLDNQFRPSIAGFSGEFRNDLLSGVANFGRGRSIVLASHGKQKELPIKALDRAQSHRDSRDRRWGRGIIEEGHIRNLLLHAVEGEKAFQALVDLHAGPEKVMAGKKAGFAVNLFSESSAPGMLLVDVSLGEKKAATQKVAIDFKGKKLLRPRVEIALPWTLQDGRYDARLAFKTDGAESVTQWSFDIESPLRLTWQFQSFYEKAGGELAGKATVHNRRNVPLSGLSLSLEVTDGNGRTLQRQRQAIELKRGVNGPYPLELHARDYRIGSYFLNLKILNSEGITIQNSQRLLHRGGPYDFTQDIVHAPWNSGASPKDPRMKKLLLESGFNTLWSMKAHPGWYNWGVFGPHPKAMKTWPGEFVERADFGYGRDTKKFSEHLRFNVPGFTILDPWDESPISTVVSDWGEDISQEASALYRNILKSKYLSLDALNESWRESYGLFHRTKKTWFRWPMPPRSRIPPPLPWNGDLTSWNQIYAWRGAEKDWREYEGSMWGTYIFKEVFRRAKKINPNHPWHWSDAFHTRLYMGARPARTNWESHYSRAMFGNTPSTIMLHFYYVVQDKRPEAIRRNYWDALAAGGRHFINWSPSLKPSQGLADDTSIWTSDYRLKIHGQAMAESIRRVQLKEQALLDTRNVHSKEVAFFYTDGRMHGSGSAPRPLFDALLFGGILPESLAPAQLRSERMPLETFKVIFLIGAKDLPETWKERLDAWKAKGGRLLNAKDFPFKYEGDRIETPGFSDYQAKLLRTLADAGVRPQYQIVDDNGLPEPSVEPVLLRTRDGSQSYVLAATDWSIRHSQSQGDLADHEFKKHVFLNGDFSRGVSFNLSGDAEKYQVWVQADVKRPFAADLTIDGKQGLQLAMNRKDGVAIRSERGTGKLRWIAGPRFMLTAGKHTLAIRVKEGQTDIRQVRIVDDLLIQPRLVLTGDVMAVYDVFNDRLLSKAGVGVTALAGSSWPLTLRASYGEIFSLITEDLGNLKVEPRLIRSETDRRLQVKIDVLRSDDSYSECRHSMNIRVLDAESKIIAGLFEKTSIKGWAVATLYAAQQDSKLPWTVEVKDLTSGRAARAMVTEETSEPFRSHKAVTPLVFEALPTPWLEGDIHIVPFRARIRNNSDTELTANIKAEFASAILLRGGPEQNITVPADGEKTIEWQTVLGRKQAIELMDHPARVWLRLNDGARHEAAFDDLYILRWEKTPPRVSNLKPADVSINVQNFIEGRISGKVTVALHQNWQTKLSLSDLNLPAGNIGKPSAANFTFKTQLKPNADQRPEIYRMPISIRIGDKTFDAGHDLVEVEKRREWLIADPPLELVDEFAPEMPEKPQDAARTKLWDLKWRPFESDTLTDFPADVGKRIFAFTNVRFARNAEVSVRIRGKEKVDVWLGGTRLITEKRKKDETESEASLELQAQKTMKVTAVQWMPLVIRYQRLSAQPLTDLVFLDSDGNVIWGADFRQRFE